MGPNPRTTTTLVASAAALALLAPSVGHAASRRTPLYVSALTPPAPVVGTDAAVDVGCRGQRRRAQLGHRHRSCGRASRR